MKAVKLVTIVMFVLLFTSRPTWAQDVEENTASNGGNGEAIADLPFENSDTLDSEVKPYQGEIGLSDLMINESEETAPLVSNESQSPEGVMANEALPATDTPQEAAVPVVAAKEEVKNMPEQALMDAIKADITERRKASGKLDIFDGTINKVRTLDLIEFKADPKQDGDMQLVQADFRDTTSGDIVTMDIKVTKDNDVYTVKEMTIASVAAPAVKEIKKEYTEEEVKSFIQEYIDTQSQATGTFDLYDEKTQKMRNLQLVKLGEKLRRYGIIAISTVEFTDKNTGDTVMVDVNTENKEGLSVTAMRLKSVTKPAPQQ
jgi:hypothetical protein